MSLISSDFFALCALALFLFYISPKSIRWMILCAVSICFYLSFGSFALIYILVISLSSYIFALLLQKYPKEGSNFHLKYILCVAVLSVLALWAFVKFFGGAYGILLPVGISFYSLRVISYLIEVKRKRVSAERNFFKYLLFVSWFPLILQGPIAEYGEISDSLYKGRCASFTELLSGIIRILWGCFKKLVIANSLASPVLSAVNDAERYSGAYVLLLIILYSAQIYCDFSGGIDIAIGVSALFGVKLPENFDRPFSSVSLREFWNRWHITLGEWFEKYVFYPVSLSKPMQRLSSLLRRRFGLRLLRRLPVYISTLLTWFLTGLWHGARPNFIAWGLINGALVLLSEEISPHLERFYLRFPKIREKRGALTALGRLRVFFIIGAVRLLDLYGDVGLTFRMLGSIFYDLQSYKSLFLGEIFSLISFPVFLAVLLSLSVVFFVSQRRIKSEDVAKRPILSSVCVFSLLFISLVFGTYGKGFSAGDFIYSRF